MAHINDGPVRCDWTVNKGGTRARTWTATQGGSAYSIAGGTLTATVKSEEDSSGAAVTGATITAAITNGAAGVFTLTPSTSSATPGRYWYSVSLTTSGGTVVPLMYGQFTITDKVAA